MFKIKFHTAKQHKSLSMRTNFGGIPQDVFSSLNIQVISVYDNRLFLMRNVHAYVKGMKTAQLPFLVHTNDVKLRAFSATLLPVDPPERS